MISEGKRFYYIDILEPVPKALKCDIPARAKSHSLVIISQSLRKKLFSIISEYWCEHPLTKITIALG